MLVSSRSAALSSANMDSLSTVLLKKLTPKPVAFLQLHRKQTRALHSLSAMMTLSRVHFVVGVTQRKPTRDLSASGSCAALVLTTSLHHVTESVASTTLMQAVCQSEVTRVSQAPSHTILMWRSKLCKAWPWCFAECCSLVMRLQFLNVFHSAEIWVRRVCLLNPQLCTVLPTFTWHFVFTNETHEPWSWGCSC